ncbi:tetratricopeptide repeat protein [Rubrivirga sp.]|uniref:tetratricopeptide repeat protein n=1 Tax=Rubrivirga sp. TaxID=1885344 RepID=UPI003C72BE63
MTPDQDVRERALRLVENRRPDLAEPELRRAIGLEPDDAHLRCLLSLVLAALDRLDDALEEAYKAIGVEPDYYYAHYARSNVLLGLGRYDEAAEAAREAVRLDPTDVTSRVQFASTLYRQREYDRALVEVGRALELDPESTGALGLRASILRQRGQHQEATELIEAALALDPDNARIHTIYGKTLLDTGREREAVDAFLEALRLEPGEEPARRGVLDAMKARNAVYRGLLRIGDWLGRLSTFWRRALIALGVVLAVASRPLFGLYLAVVLLGWIGQPLYNVALLSDPFGRRVLTRAETIGGPLIAACLGLGMIAIVAGIAFDQSATITAGGVLLTMSIPISVVVKMTVVETSRIPLLATVGLGALGVGLVVTTAMESENEGLFGGCYVLGMIGAAWIASKFTR